MTDSRTRAQHPGGQLKYRTMRNVSLVIGMATALVLGYAVSAFDLSESQAMVVAGLFVLGIVPPNIYLHFIAKAVAQNPSEDGPSAASTSPDPR